MTYKLNYKSILFSVALFGVLVGCSFGEREEIYQNKNWQEIAKQRQCTGEDDPYKGYDVADHIFEIDSRGRVAGTKVQKLGEEWKKFPSAFTNFSAAYNRYQQSSTQPNQSKIILYFNGGLNTSATVRAQAIRQVPCMIKDGYFPVFMVWHTGAWETYREQTAFVNNGRAKDRFDFIGFLPKLIGDVGQGGARSLMTLADQGARRWESAFNRSEKFFVKRDLKDPWNKNLLLEPIADRSPGLGKENLYYYASLPFRVASTPFVDSIGSSA